MAKATKKLKKTKKTKVVVPEVPKREVPLAMPPILPGLVSISMAPSDLQTLTDLMSVTAQTFEKLALDAAEAKDDASYTVLSARYRLSNNFATKFAEFIKMPEPESRDIH